MFGIGAGSPRFSRDPGSGRLSSEKECLADWWGWLGVCIRDKLRKTEESQEEEKKM
jgi:hypothetical protein